MQAWRLTGYQAGSGQMQAKVDDMASRYDPSVVRGFLNVAEPIGGTAAQVHKKLAVDTSLYIRMPARGFGGV